MNELASTLPEPTVSTLAGIYNSLAAQSQPGPAPTMAEGRNHNKEPSRQTNKWGGGGSFVVKNRPVTILFNFIIHFFHRCAPPPRLLGWPPGAAPRTPHPGFYLEED